MRKGTRGNYRREHVTTACMVMAETSLCPAAEVGFTNSERTAYNWADRNHEKTGCKTWIVDLDTGLTIYTRETKSAPAMAGGAR